MTDGPLPTPQVQDLARTFRVVVGQFRRRLNQALPPGELPLPQVAVLRHLAATGQATISGLARMEGMRPQSMNPTVTAMEAAGLLVSRPDPDDGRQRLYAMTPAAQALITDLQASRQDWLTGAFGRLSAQELSTLENAVALLERLMDPR